MEIFSPQNNYQPCDIADIKNLNNTKHYLFCAAPLLEGLLLAVQNEMITRDAMAIWIYLYNEVKFNHDWAVRQSVRSIAKVLKMSPSTAQKALTSLKEYGFLVTGPERNTLKQEANLIKVRYPKCGIDYAKLAKDRTQTRQDTNSVIAQPYQNQTTASTITAIIPQAKSNTNNDLQEITSEESPANEAAVMSNKLTDEADTNKETKNDDKTQTPQFIDGYDPLDEQIRASSSALSRLVEQHLEAKSAYSANPKDNQLFLAMTSLESKIHAAKINLESLKTNKLSTEVYRETVHRCTDKQYIIKNKYNNKIQTQQTSPVIHKVDETKPSSTQKPNNCCFSAQMKNKPVTPEIVALVTKTLQREAKDLGLSNPEEMIKQVLFSVSRFNFGKDERHRANICLKKVRETKTNPNAWKTPIGYIDEALAVRDAKAKLEELEEYCVAELPLAEIVRSAMRAA